MRGDGVPPAPFLPVVRPSLCTVVMQKKIIFMAFERAHINSFYICFVFLSCCFFLCLGSTITLGSETTCPPFFYQTPEYGFIFSSRRSVSVTEGINITFSGHNTQIKCSVVLCMEADSGADLTRFVQKVVFSEHCSSGGTF